MQTTQKDSFFFLIIDSLFEIYGVRNPVISIQSEVVLIRTQAVKFCKKFDYFKKSLPLNKKTFWLNINQLKVKYVKLFTETYIDLNYLIIE